MTRIALGLALLAAPALAQSTPPKTDAGIDARLAAVDQQLARFAKLGFDPKSPAPAGDLPELRKRTVEATQLLEMVRVSLAQLQAGTQAEIDAKGAEFNADVRRFRAANTVAAAHMHFLDRVAANPTKESMDRNSDTISKNWMTWYGQDLRRLESLEGSIQKEIEPYLADAKKAGYTASGLANPYSRDYLAKFYEGGTITVAVWTAGVEGWKRYQADAKVKAERFRSAAADLETKARDLDEKFAALEAKVAAVEPAVTKASDTVNRADLVGSWKGELSQGTKKIGVTLEIAADGTITNTAANGLSGKGTWTRVGDRLNVRWQTGEPATWTLRDGKITGGGTARGEKWSIEFTKG